MKGEVVFPTKTLFPVSDTLKKLIKRMLKKDKDTRLSATEALKDIWFLSLK